MKKIIVMDLKDYDENWPRSKRPSVRAIIMRNGKIAMVHSLKYNYYKFPGGGIEQGEDHNNALIREVREETGLSVIDDTIKEYGLVLRIQKSQYFKNTIFEQENYYYLCEIDESIDTQILDEYEAEEKFTLEFVDIEEAIRVNKSCNSKPKGKEMIERETLVLERLMNEKI